MITIYGSSSCIWCEKAKELAETYSLAYEYKSIDNSHYKEQLLELLPEVKTIPQIWWHDNYIGGYEDLVTEIENTRNFGQEAC